MREDLEKALVNFIPTDALKELVSESGTVVWSCCGQVEEDVGVFPKVSKDGWLLLEHRWSQDDISTLGDEGHCERLRSFFTRLDNSVNHKAEALILQPLDIVIIDCKHSSQGVELKNVLKIFTRLFTILSQLEYYGAFVKLVFQVWPDLNRPIADRVIKVANDCSCLDRIQFAPVKKEGVSDRDWIDFAASDWSYGYSSQDSAEIVRVGRAEFKFVKVCLVSKADHWVSRLLRYLEAEALLVSSWAILGLNRVLGKRDILDEGWVLDEVDVGVSVRLFNLELADRASSNFNDEWNVKLYIRVIGQVDLKVHLVRANFALICCIDDNVWRAPFIKPGK